MIASRDTREVSSSVQSHQANIAPGCAVLWNDDHTFWYQRETGFQDSIPELGKVNSRLTSQQPITTWRSRYSSLFVLGFHVQSDRSGFFVLLHLFVGPPAWLYRSLWWWWWWWWCCSPSNFTHPVQHRAVVTASSDIAQQLTYRVFQPSLHQWCH